MSSSKSNPAGETTDQIAIDLIWDLLDRSDVLPDLVTTWPGINAVAVREKLIPLFDPDAGPMPTGFAYFLIKDLRDMSISQRVDRAARFLSSLNVERYSDTWINLLHSFLVIYTGCKHPRSTRGQSRRLDAIKRNIEGLNLDVGDENVPHNRERNDDNDDKKKNETHLYDLTKSIQSMTSLFPESSRPTGEEDESFTSRLKPILEQMETLGIDEHQRPSVLYSLLPSNSPARNACDKIKLQSIHINDMVDEIKKKVLFDNEIQDRRVTRWDSTTYEQFRSLTSSEESATRKCLEFITEYQKDLPKHMLAPEHLYNRLRNIFRSVRWCETLFQRTESHEDPTSFGQKLISAAANFDIRSKKQYKPVVPFHATQTPAPTGTSPTNPHSDLVAFFSKTPPPPRHRRPRRFMHGRPGYNRFRSHSEFNKFPYRPRPYWMRPSALSRSRSRPRIVCYGCRQEGHILRDCPHRNRHHKQFQYFIDLGDAAAFFLSNDANEVDDPGHDVLHYFADAEEQLFSQDDTNNDADNDLDAWLAEFFEVYDRSDSPLSSTANSSLTCSHVSTGSVVPLSLPQLKDIMDTLTLYSNSTSTQYILLDTGAPRSFCSENWLKQASWAPLQKVDLPLNTPPFRFAGHPVRTLYGVKLAASIFDITGKRHILKIFVYVLPSTPIPFLFGLTDQRRLAFDICLREKHASHLRLTTFDAVFPLMVTSHVWLRFEPLHQCSPTTPDWDSIVSKSSFESSITHLNTVPPSMTFLIDSDSSIPNEHHPTYLLPPWRRDNWTPTISRMELFRLHRALKHPETTSLSKIIRQSLGQRPLLPELRKELDNFRCSECEETPELPRKPKLALPPEATPNLAVSLDVMPHVIHNKSTNILVIIDHGDMLLRLALLHNNSAPTAFNAFYSRWISIFDAPSYVIVDRGSNLAAEYMKNKLHEVDSQLCPIPTEAPWGIGLNERSHRYLHKSINRLLLQRDYDTGHEHQVLLADVETGWNYALHTNNVIPHYHRFGIMPRSIGNLEECPRLTERIALMELARKETECLRARNFISRALNNNRRHIVPTQSFAIHEKVWFHRHRHGWRQGTVASINHPTVMVELDRKLYPTHHTRVRHFYGELSIPPPLKDDQLLPDRPNTSPEQTVSVRAPISAILNPVFVASHIPEPSNLTFEIPDTSISISIVQPKTLDIDSDSVFLTVTKVIKDYKSLSDVDKKAFDISKREEIDFMLKKAVKPIPIKQVPNNVELQPLKWVLAKKTNTIDDSKNRHRSRIVSASHRTALRHSVHGNAPTVMLSTLRILTSILPTWMKLILKVSQNDRIIMFCRDVHKAFIQSLKSQRMIIYRPPPEFFEYYPQFLNHVWQAYIQIYGEVEAGLYWHRTLVPWLIQNIPDLQQSIFDPSLLFSPTKMMAILLCTDDTFVAIPESLLEKKVQLKNDLSAVNAFSYHLISKASTFSVIVIILFFPKWLI